MTRAMVAAGGPYTDPGWAAHFMQAFRESWRETTEYVRQELLARSHQPSAISHQHVQTEDDDAVETPRQPTPDSQLPTPDEVRAAAQVEGVPLPETEDPDQLGYPIDPKAMSSYMSTIKKTAESQQLLAVSHQQEGDESSQATAESQHQEGEDSQTTEVVTTGSGPATTAGAEAE